MNKKTIQSILISLTGLLMINLIFAYLLPTPQLKEIISWIISNLFMILILVISWQQLPTASLRFFTTIFLTMFTIFIAEFLLSLLFVVMDADLRTTLFMEAGMFLTLIMSTCAVNYFTADDTNLANRPSKQILPRNEYSKPNSRKPMIK